MTGERDRYELWLRDEAGWKAAVEANCTEGYGFSVIAAAAFWMLGMQDAMSGSSTFEREVFGEQRAGIELTPELMERARKAANEAMGQWELTGFQMGACVSIVARVWEHGEAVRRWWNLTTQLGNEGEQANESGGVLNPALLAIRLPGDGARS